MLKKIEDVQAMCSKRKEDLRVKVNAIPTHPVQPDIVTSTSRGQTTVPDYDMRRRGRQGRRHGEEHEPPKKSSQQQMVEKSARVSCVLRLSSQDQHVLGHSCTLDSKF